MKQKCIAMTILTAGAAFVAQAASIWTGAQDNFWTNSANWANGVVPGVLDDENKWSATATQDTAQFSRTSTNTTIDLDGLFYIKSMTFSGDIPRYTLGTSKDQIFRLKKGGSISVASGTAHAPTFLATLSPNCCATTTDTGYLTVDNYATDALIINNIGAQAIDPDHKPGYYQFAINFQRSGPVTILGQFVEPKASCRSIGFDIGNVQVNDNLEGVFHLTANSSGSLTIAKGKCITLDTSLGGTRCELYHDATFNGEGILKVGPNRNNVGDLRFANSAVVMMSCRLGEVTAGNGAWVRGPGTLVLTRTDNEIAGSFDIWPWAANDRTTVAAVKIGANGETGSLGDSSAVTFAGLATLRYDGTGETTTRAMSIVDQSNTGTGGGATLEQNGTGVWTVAAPFGLASRTSASLVTLTGAATAAPAVYSAVLADGASSVVSLAKAGTGTWTLSGANTYSGETTISGGTLALADAGTFGTGGVSFCGGTLAVGADVSGQARSMGAVTVTSGANVLDVGAGVSVSATTLTQTAGTLDVNLSKGATFTCVALASTRAPSWLTLGGRAAQFDANGNIGLYDYSEATGIAARGGVVPNGSGTDVAFTTDGEEGAGPATLGATTVTVNTLVEKTAADATVKIAAGQTLTTPNLVRMPATGAFTVGENATDGAFVASGDRFVIDNRDDAEALVVKTPTTISGAKVLKVGAGAATLPMPAGWSGTVTVDEGSFTATLPSGATTIPFAIEGGGDFVTRLAGDATVEAKRDQADFTGTYEVQGGTLKVSSEKALGCGTNAVIIGTGATLDVATDVSLEGPVSGAGEVVVSGGTGAKLLLGQPVDDPSRYTVSSGVVSGDTASWSAANALAFLNGATFGTAGYWCAEVPLGSTWSFALANLTASGAGVGVTGGGTLALTGAADMPAVRIAAYDGTLKIAGDAPFAVNGGSVGATGTNPARIVIDGADVTRTDTQPIYIGEKLADGTLAEGRMVVTDGSFVLGDMPSDNFSENRDRSIALGAYGRGVLDVRDGGAVTARVVTSGSDYKKVGAIWVRTGGSFVMRKDSMSNHSGLGTPETDVQNYLGAFGGDVQTWGTASFSRWGTTVVQLDGGSTLSFRDKSGASGGTCYMPYGGNAQVYLHNATVDVGQATFTLSYQTGNGVLSLDGASALLTGSEKLSVQLTEISQYSGSATLNVRNGGTVRAVRIAPASSYVSAAHFAGVTPRVNFDGGVLEFPAQYSNVFSDELPESESERVGKTPPPQVRVFAGGMTVKTQYKGSSINCPVANATGKGVVSIPLDAPITGIVAAPYVTISGGGGEGATAFALFDPVTESVTNIVVTCPGWDYTSAPTATLTYENATLATLSCEIADNGAGDFTFEGTTLNAEINLGATNAWGGVTVLKGGKVILKKQGAIPADSTVVFRGGQILAGTDGVTLPTKYAVDFADAANGGAVYPADFTFPEGSTISLRNLDLAELEKISRRVTLLRFTGTVTGTPTIDFPEIPGWRVTWRDGTLRLTRIQGTLLFVR